jgi:hypothetical protein
MGICAAIGAEAADDAAADAGADADAMGALAAVSNTLLLPLRCG